MKIVFKACVRNFKLSVPIIPKKGEGPGNPSITDGVHRTENFVEIIPVFFNFFKLFQKKKKEKNYKSHFM